MTSSDINTIREALELARDLIAYSGLRTKVRLREDPTEYEEAERLLARFDVLSARVAAASAPDPEPCEACRGTGAWSEPYIACSSCGGTGEVSVPASAPDPRDAVDAAPGLPATPTSGGASAGEAETGAAVVVNELLARYPSASAIMVDVEILAALAALGSPVEPTAQQAAADLIRRFLQWDALTVLPDPLPAPFADLPYWLSEFRRGVVPSVDAPDKETT